VILSINGTLSQTKPPELDEKHFRRNHKTAWLHYLDKLAAWLWQDHEGAARWTLIIDDALHHASTNHPPNTAAGFRSFISLRIQ
jgi:hypothetical protein